MRWAKIAGAALLLLPVQLSAQTTWHVYPLGRSIQETIDLADPGDIVLVHGPWTYRESITLASGVSVREFGDGQVIIDGEDADQTVLSVGNGGGLTFADFTIEGGLYNAVSLDVCSNMDVVGIDITYTGQLCAGLQCNGNSTAHLEDISVWPGFPRGIQIYGYASSGPVLEDPEVDGADEGIFIGNCCTVRSVEIDNCGKGILAFDAEGTVCEGGTIEDCDEGIHVYAGSIMSSPVTFTGVTVSGVSTSYGAWVTGWHSPPRASYVDFDGCTFQTLPRGIGGDRFFGSIEDCTFDDISSTAVEISGYHGELVVGGLGQGEGNTFSYVDGIGIHLGAGAKVAVRNNAFDHVLGTAIECETGTDGTLITDCTLDGSGGCFEGIATSGSGTLAEIKDCVITDYDSTGVKPGPRGVYVYGPSYETTAYLGRWDPFAEVEDPGNNWFDNTGAACDLIYTGPSGGTPEELYAQKNYWGENPPDLRHFGGRWHDYIVYQPYLTGPPQGAPPAPEDYAATPDAVGLSAVYPNPAVGGARFSYQLPAGGGAEVTLWDLAGRRITTLVSGRLPAGVATVKWDGTDEAGGPVPSGAYVCRLTSSHGEATRRFVFMR